MSYKDFVVHLRYIGRGDDTVGNPHGAQKSQFDLFELILLSKLDKQFPVEQFEATVSQSTVVPPKGKASSPVKLVIASLKPFHHHHHHIIIIINIYIYISLLLY